MGGLATRAPGKRLLLLLLLVTSLSVAACGGGTGEVASDSASTDDTTASSESAEPDSGQSAADGAPFGRAAIGEARGAPVRMPAIQQVGGFNPAQMVEFITNAIRDQCGTPELCVNLVLVDQNGRPATDDKCKLAEGQDETTVPRGSVVTLRFNCDGEPETGDDDGSDTTSPSTTRAGSPSTTGS